MNAEPNEPLGRLAERCAMAGIPVTPQRRAVLEVLLERHDHPTADQLFGAVRDRLPQVSRATVYRTLETLQALDLVRRVEHAGSAVRFDGNTDPHHHLLCTACGVITDLPCEAVEGVGELRYRDATARGDEEIAVLVRGRCRSCATP